MFKNESSKSISNKTSETIPLPKILPDEFILGYVGRVGKINDLGTVIEVSRALKVDVNAFRKSTTARMIPLLAQALEVEVTYVLKHHTLFPILKSLSSEDVNVIDAPGVKQGIGWIKTSPISLKNPKRVACFCKACVIEDMNYLEFSFWRRSHQLPGIDWCLKHQEPLQEVHHEHAFMVPPSIFLSRGNYLNQESSVWMNNPIIKRYAQLIEDAAELDKPVNKDVAKASLLKQARAFGIETSSTEVTKRLSDLMYEKLPEQWVDKFIPCFTKKAYGEYLVSFDEMLKSSGKPKSYLSVLLVAAVLFESADEAMHQLIRSVDEVAYEIAKPIVSGQTFTRAYIRHRGNYKKMSDELDLDHRKVSAFARGLGLPSMTRVSNHTLKAIIDFYRGTGLSEILSRPEVDKESFEKIIRLSGRPLSDSINRF